MCKQKAYYCAPMCNLNAMHQCAIKCCAPMCNETLCTNVQSNDVHQCAIKCCAPMCNQKVVHQCAIKMNA